MIDTVIVGAGPYGLSLGAHLRHRGIQFRIFGRVMDLWVSHMPNGMLLKSDGFASNISDPNGEFTLSKFCSQNHIEYADVALPVRRETFCAYGAAFKDRMVPELEDKIVTRVSPAEKGFAVQLDDGETLIARRVVLAVGMTHYSYVPDCLSHLPPEFGSHSSAHCDLEPFRGRSVAVIGAGSSALDLAGLLHNSGAHVQLIARSRELKFHSRGSAHRSLWQRLRHPQSGLGAGIKSRFFSEWPHVFRYLPESYRLQAVRTHLGPSGGWFAKDMVMGRVSLLLGYAPEGATVKDGQVQLRLRQQNGGAREISVDHVISATGYRVELSRLPFLDERLRSKIKLTGTAPKLSSGFESSVPGLYFVGISAANSFGPLMRFAYGARFAAERVTADLARGFSSNAVTAAIPDVVASVK